MKHLYNMAWGLLLVAGLASCEMKNELFDEKGSGETGVLEIGVAVNKAIDNVATRAGEDDADEGVAVPVEGDEVAADGFEIDITGEDNFSEQITYNSGETNSISLPVGTYTVYAHTPGEMARVMDDPYYGGTTTDGTIAITSGVTSTASIKCVMENTRIMLGYDDQFLATYKSWNITVENGSDDQVLSAVYDGTGEPPVIDKYWDLGDGVASVIVKGTAVLKEGGASVPVSKVLTKVNGEDFVGAEALNITLVLGSGGVSGSLAGVDVEVNLFGTEPDDTDPVEVPIVTEDDPINPPTPPVEGDLSVVFPNGQNTATFTLPDQANDDATAKIVAPAGLKNINVTIQAQGSFASIVSAMHIGNFDLLNLEPISVGGQQFDLANTIQEILQSELPGEGATSYDFPVHKFFTIITGMQGASDETHVFTVEVVDANDERTTATLTINVKAKAEGQEPAQGE